MELDLWSGAFQLAGDWDLDMPDLDVIGQLGDLKQHSPDDAQRLQPQDDMSDFSHFKEEGGLGLSDDWMESTDIASFFDALGDHPSSLLESSLLDIETDIIAESSDSIATVPDLLDSNVKEDSRIQLNSLAPLNILSPPESPKDVCADSVIQPNIIASQNILSPPEFTDVYTGLKNEPDFVKIVVPKIMLGGQKVISGEDLIISDGVELFLEVHNEKLDSKTVSHSEMSCDSAGSSLHSFPSSPESSNCSIIQSSPELFKVISASNSQRYAPYEKQKSKQCIKSTDFSKKSRKTKAPAVPVPEHVIMEETNKKDRKKLQNKNAAIRYRMKKKEEADEIKGEEEELEEINCKLRTKVDDLEREVKYMKNLMQDVYKAKGIKI